MDRNQGGCKLPPKTTIIPSWLKHHKVEVIDVDTDDALPAENDGIAKRLQAQYLGLKLSFTFVTFLRNINDSQIAKQSEIHTRSVEGNCVIMSPVITIPLYSLCYIIKSMMLIALAEQRLLVNKVPYLHKEPFDKQF